MNKKMYDASVRERQRKEANADQYVPGEGRIPFATRSASSIVLRTCSYLAYLVALVHFFLGAVIWVVLAMTWHPIPNMPPTPQLNWITLGGLAGFIFFVGLAIIFIGTTLSSWRKELYYYAIDQAGGNRR